MTLPHNTIQPAPYTVWIDYGSEGWSPHECATVADCLDTISQYSGQGYRVTRTVTLIDPDATPAPAASCRWCGCPERRCLGYDQTKCCPDCNHTPAVPTSGGGEHATLERLGLEQADYRTTDAEYLNR